jgi:5-(carboxyamino)imidazole ribonucleotide mutase
MSNEPSSMLGAGPLVGVIMGSQSDWETMQHAAATLTALGIAHECRVVKVVIAGAGGAAHLPGMCASKTDLPVLGVPVESKALQGVDSLLSIVQMPAGIPVGTLAIGRAGAVNAAVLAASILSHLDAGIARRLADFRAKQTADVLANPVPGAPKA